MLIGEQKTKNPVGAGFNNWLIEILFISFLIQPLKAHFWDGHL